MNWLLHCSYMYLANFVKATLTVCYLHIVKVLGRLPKLQCPRVHAVAGHSVKL